MHPPRQRAPKLRWVTTTLTDHPVEDTLPRYQAWEAEATAAVSIDVMDNHTGNRYPALEGHTTVAAMGLLVVVACALQHLGQSEEDHDPPIDRDVIEELIESFSFSEIKKSSLAAKHCTVLC